MTEYQFVAKLQKNKTAKVTGDDIPVHFLT